MSKDPMKRRFEHMKYLQVIALSADQARRFFDMPNAYVVDAGPPPAERANRYAPEARVWHVYPKKPPGAPLRLVVRNGERVS